MSTNEPLPPIPFSRLNQTPPPDRPSFKPFNPIRPSPYRTYWDISVITHALSDESLMMSMFEDWMSDHNRVYSSEEEKLYRLRIFSEWAKRVYDENTAAPADDGNYPVINGNYPFELGPFSDHTMDELNPVHDCTCLSSPRPHPPNCVFLRSQPPPPSS